METLLGLLTSRIGLLAIAFASIVLFYEGVPLGPLRWIPYVGPVLEQLVDGRVDRERKAGQLAERQVWQELQRKLMLQHLADEKAKQAELDAIAAQYEAQLDQRQSDAAKIAALEYVLNKEETNAPPDSGNRVAIPRSVSKQLDAVGR